MIVDLDFFGSTLTIKGTYIPKQEAITFPPEKACPPEAAMYEIDSVKVGDRDITSLLESIEYFLDTFRVEEGINSLTGESLFNYLEDEVIKQLEKTK